METSPALMSCLLTNSVRLIAALLAMAGFNVRSIRAGTKLSQRNSIIQAFNDKSSKMQILVASLLNMASGVDLHHECHHGIIVNTHPSAMGDDHVKGRLGRQGQEHMPEWCVLHTQDTFNDYQEQNVLKKKVRLLAVTGVFPKWLCPFLREIMSYEMLKTSLNTPFNRYAWIVVREHCPKYRRSHSTKMRKTGHMCSILVRMLLAATEPEHTDFLNQKPEFTVEALYNIGCEMSLSTIENNLEMNNQDVLTHMLPILEEWRQRAEAEEDDDCRRRVRRRLEDAVARSHGDIDVNEEADEEGAEDAVDEQAEDAAEDLAEEGEGDDAPVNGEASAVVEPVNNGQEVVEAQDQVRHDKTALANEESLFVSQDDEMHDDRHEETNGGEGQSAFIVIDD